MNPFIVKTILADSATIIIVIAVALNAITDTRRGLLDFHHPYELRALAPDAVTTFVVLQLSREQPISAISSPLSMLS
jgi:hypothetical protein